MQAVSSFTACNPTVSLNEEANMEQQRQRKAHHRAPLEVQSRLLQAYWEVLLQDERFCEEWRILCHSERCKKWLQLREQWDSMKREKKRKTAGVLTEMFIAQSDFYSHVKLFCYRWKLPWRLYQSIIETFASVPKECCSSPHVLEEIAQGKLCLITTRLSPYPYGRSPKRKRHKFRIVMEFPEYDPLTQSREAYLASCRKQALKQIEKQGREYCREVERATKEGLSFDSFHRPCWNRYRDSEYIKRVAKQVYLRVVKGWSWGQISSCVRGRRATVEHSTNRAIDILSPFLPFCLQNTPRSV
ncbi:MAG: hypothetical protein K6U12_04450 [Armatimonadetes bacterium]|nr:hypothetical protein [Armatimonadota bacterium]